MEGEKPANLLNVLDLFSGVGSNTIALTGYTNTIAYCEKDKHAQAVLKSRMRDGYLPNVPIFHDVEVLTKENIVEKVDMIIGGFPCQDISLAGRGDGIWGSRSSLFFQILRLADEIQPRFLFLENVPAIRTRGLNVVLQELAQRGYDCRWTMLSAAKVGAPHKRERWFLLASNSQRFEFRKQPGWGSVAGGKEKAFARIDGEEESLAYPDSQRIRENIGTISREQNKRYKAWGYGPSCRSANAGALAYSLRERLQRSERDCEELQKATWFARYNHWAIEPNLGGVVDGNASKLDQSLQGCLDRSFWEKEPEGIPRVTQEKEQRSERLKRLGNAVVPLQARTAFEMLMFNIWH